VADLDAMVEAERGCSVAELFQREGEPAFRRLESRILEQALAAGAGIISCGGGIVLDPEHRRLLAARCRVVWLEVGPATAALRLANTGGLRPLLAAGAAAQSLPRSANGGCDPAGKVTPVQVPRYPYAGAWEGSLALDGGAAKAPSRVLINFSVADGAKQAYDGDTTIDGRAAAKHVNISSASAPEGGEKTASAPVMRRSAGTSPSPALAPGSAPEVDTLAAGSICHDLG
jgi:hypothetical protein